MLPGAHVTSAQVSRIEAIQHASLAFSLADGNNLDISDIYSANKILSA